MSNQESRPTAEEIKGQKLPYPARQSQMQPQPDSDLSNYKAAGKLVGKIALITGADSGIGRAIAIAFAMEGADVAVFIMKTLMMPKLPVKWLRHVEKGAW